jgi:hypothetical protein
LGHGIFIDKKNGTSYTGTFNNSKRNGTKDESAEFTLNHGLFGTFSFHGGKKIGEEHKIDTTNEATTINSNGGAAPSSSSNDKTTNIEQSTMPTPGSRERKENAPSSRKSARVSK